MNAPDAPRPTGPGPGRVGLLLLWAAVAFAYFVPGRIEPQRAAEDARVPRRLERVGGAEAIVALRGSADGDVWVVRREAVGRYPGAAPARAQTVLDAPRYRERFGRHLDPFTAGHLDARGALWVGSRRGEILVFQDGAWLERSSRFAEPTDPILAIATRGDEVYAAGRGLWHAARREGRFALEERFGRHRIDHLVAGDALGVALATAGEVWLRSRDDAEWTRVWQGGSTDGALGALAAGPDGELWIGTQSGLVRIGRDGSLRRELTGRPVAALAVGRAVALAGTRDAGLYVRYAGDWRRVDGLRDAELAGVSALATAPGGSFWVVLRGRGLYRAGPAREELPGPRG